MKNQDYMVNLVGDSEIGLPIDHQDVLCIDIGDRDDVKEYMYYDPLTGNFFKKQLCAESVMTTTETRETAYEQLTTRADGSPLILWEQQAITIDQANKIYLNYTAEKSVKAIQIQELIISAKSYIRELYPDN